MFGKISAVMSIVNALMEIRKNLDKEQMDNFLDAIEKVAADKDIKWLLASCKAARVVLDCEDDDVNDSDPI